MMKILILLSDTLKHLAPMAKIDVSVYCDFKVTSMAVTDHLFNLQIWFSYRYGYGLCYHIYAFSINLKNVHSK